MSKEKKLDGGDLVVKCLIKERVRKIFGIVGGELLSIYDAIERWGREEGIDTVMVRHEQAGGHAADGWARATGELGVCLGTVGPGVTHLVPAVAAAWADSIPLLVIGAQIGRMFEDTGILQGGLDQISLMKPITKAQITVEEPHEIPESIQKAIRIAMSGRKRPVFLEFRETALVRDAKEEDLKKILEPEKYRSMNRPSGDPSAIKRVVNILNQAEKPIIISGGGAIASGASKDLIKLSSTYSLPSGTTINGIGSIDCTNDTYIGSYLTANSFRTAASKADVVISIGAKWDYTLLYGTAPIWNQKQKVIQIDIDPNEIGKNRAVNESIIGDAKAVINQLLEEMENTLNKERISVWSEWNNYLQEIRKRDLESALKIAEKDTVPIKPKRLVYEILNYLPSDGLLALDGGDIAVFTFGMMSHFPRNPRTVFFPISMGHLGTGLPHALGAKLAKPNKPIICLTGDGSFMFNVQELETLVRLNLPIVTVIANNCAWGMIKSKQKGNFSKRYCDVDFPATNYAEIAKGFGCYGEKITEPSQIRSAMQRAFDSNKPAVLDVDIAFETPAAMKIVGLYKKNKGLFG